MTFPLLRFVLAVLPPALLLLPMAAFGESSRPLILVDATAVRATNLAWGEPKSGPTGLTIDLQAESSLTPSQPYYAEFAFATSEAGEYDAWALVFGAGDVPHLSSWSWSLDGAPAQVGKALPGSLAGTPRWVRFARVQLSAGEHSLRFTVTGRRYFPDDAYLFHLYKVILAPVGENFSPGEAGVELGFNPQGDQPGATPARGRPPAGVPPVPGRTILLRSEIADPVRLQVDLQNVLPPVQPVWRDFSEGGVETGGDFLIPRLAQPLRPRFYRKCHVLSLAKITRGAEGRLTGDFREALDVVRAMRAVGAEPIIDLANPPGLILKDAQGQPIPVSDWAANPTFQKEWSEVVTSFLQALRESNLAVKYFTSFNEPEFSALKTSGHDASSLTIWKVAAAAVKAFDPSFQMAGMEFGNARSGVYQSFLEEIRQRPGNLDVFSFHQYNSTPERLAREIKGLRAELDKRALQRVKIAVDEWGVASSGQIAHRSGTRAATYHASCLKAMAEAGLDIGGLFCFRDYPKEGWKWGMITGDGYLKPTYWGAWLWAQLPENNARLSVTGGNDRVQTFAFQDGAGLALLVWYDAPENAPVRDVSLTLPTARWAGSTTRQWQLDSMRHIGYIPEGSPVELPCSLRSEKFPAPAPPTLAFKMLPASMRLIKMQPLASDEKPVPSRPLLLDHETMSTSQFRALSPAAIK